MGKDSKRSKKHKKHSKKRRDSISSSEEEWVEAELVKTQKEDRYLKKNYEHNSSDSSTEEPIKKKQKHRDRRESSSDSDGSQNNDRKILKSKKKSNRRCSSSDEYSDKDIHKKVPENKLNDNGKLTDNKREDWMNLSTNFSSFSNKDRRKQREHDKKQQKEAEQYNPRNCPRELNPFWKDGGDGLPKFQMPKDDDDDSDDFRYNRSKNYVKPQSSWRKTIPTESKTRDSYNENKSEKSREPMASSSKTNVDKESEGKVMTEKDLNLLAGKLVKAEIMGNEKLVKELKEKLEIGRKALIDAKSQGEEVLLTETNRQGHSKPLTMQTEYEEISSGKKQRKKAMETHKDKERVRYFPDDDKYSLKQMFENEKFNSGNNQDNEFVKLVSSVRKNDDLDDLFTDNVRRKKSDAKQEEASLNKAINEHKKMSESLDNCSKCLQSSSMQKHLIISLGQYVYLSVPAHEPLLEGHCLIVPIRHVQSVTQLDENEWDEIKDFRRSLVKLFATKNEEPIFFEIAKGFHRYPHMVLECVPMPKEDGDMAPIYFKKAIDESETEWAQNKKLVSLKGRDVRKAIPKGLPYFSVSFGMDEGFAHVIEDEGLFPQNFAQEIIGGILDLHHSKWRKPIRQSFDVQSKRVLQFSNEWKEFDCTAKQ